MPTTPQNPLNNITDAPDGDAKISADNYAYDTPNTADNDARYTE